MAMKKKMTKTESKKYKQLLLKQRENLNEEFCNLKQNNINKSQRDASGDLSSYTYHMADMASDTYDKDFSMGIAAEEQKRLFAIEEALKRISDGTYGSCLQCGKRITKKRLDAIPHTELCIECQKSKEKKK